MATATWRWGGTEPSGVQQHLGYELQSVLGKGSYSLSWTPIVLGSHLCCDDVSQQHNINLISEHFILGSYSVEFLERSQIS